VREGKGGKGRGYRPPKYFGPEPPVQCARQAPITATLQRASNIHRCCTGVICIAPPTAPPDRTRCTISFTSRLCWTSLAVGPKITRTADIARLHAAAVDRYLLPATDLSSKPAARRCCCRSTGQTDGRTDGDSTFL